LDDKIYIMEFKVIEVDKTKGSALEQIKRKKYSEKYQQKGKKIYLVGIEFSKDDKNIQNFMWEDWTEMGMINAKQEKSQDM
ncbi:MAG: PD-(D/E)XK nuclease domain-containing protein, partial [Desulfobacterales bacterium]|nr:PD-(D/E)XK nuclease domain-containing protein [Desulfobacterales bacterium]